MLLTCLLLSESLRLVKYANVFITFT